MSKVVDAFLGKSGLASDFAKRASRTLTPGSRMFPIDKREDATTQLRLDAGEKIGDVRNVVLQVSSQAKNTALKKWVQKQSRGTHTKLATAKFNTKADDMSKNRRESSVTLRHRQKASWVEAHGLLPTESLAILVVDDPQITASRYHSFSNLQNALDSQTVHALPGMCMSRKYMAGEADHINIQAGHVMP